MELWKFRRQWREFPSEDNVGSFVANGENSPVKTTCSGAPADESRPRCRMPLPEPHATWKGAPLADESRPMTHAVARTACRLDRKKNLAFKETLVAEKAD
ncbi:hypothetical protein JTE90_007980 [Oedothorax gibbosus]|uniref:Uncharacterized protein n=1 Tax=Oedothorax gibbosus TaxID=931172 RepID=A0AAV6TTS3_9ARAC|nr:hypothetical protein JTE90_007980 [Oedothorax gibbosus]